MFVAALSVALPLAAAPAEAASDVSIMDRGPTSLILRQLDSGGYEPVGAGISVTSAGQERLVSIWENDDHDWIITSGNKSTTSVTGRGTDLEVGTWAPTTTVSYQFGDQNGTVLIQSENAASNCLPFDAAEENVLRRQFTKADLITGTFDNGAQMQTYAEEGGWLTIAVGTDADRTTCAVSAGYKFQLAP